jgi:hypothetical protein
MKTRVPMWASASGGIALVLAGVVVASILLGASGHGAVEGLPRGNAHTRW